MTQSMPRQPTSDAPRKGQDDALVRTFMAEFGENLSAGDGKAIAQTWAVPALVMMKDGAAQAVTSRDEVEKFFSGAKAQYTARGIDQAIPEVKRIEWLTDDVVQADVRWPYIDGQGNEIGEESSVYTLKRAGSRLELCMIVMRGEKKH